MSTYLRTLTSGIDGIIESMERTVGRECTADEDAHLRDMVS